MVALLFKESVVSLFKASLVLIIQGITVVSLFKELLVSLFKESLLSSLCKESVVSLLFKASLWCPYYSRNPGILTIQRITVVSLLFKELLLSLELLLYVRYFSSGDPVDFSQYIDCNIITGAVKLYLRELPIPLVSFDTYAEIIKATGMRVLLVITAFLTSILQYGMLGIIINANRAGNLRIHSTFNNSGNTS